MKFVKADWDPNPGGFNLDPSAYLAELPKIREALPAGAREFAFDAGHYSMRSNRCVKDLELAGIHVATDKNGVLTLEFAPNQCAFNVRGIATRRAENIRQRYLLGGAQLGQLDRPPTMWAQAWYQRLMGAFMAFAGLVMLLGGGALWFG
ncbi:hypothetical protein FBY35_6590 [Streptomyces sp. SLBN-118]|uniref:hypothetical protein n=1 Tax=Streptomyces sp. SLBN-118 TaxID=2768454 RepID=UPI001174AE24|nr:hypothetical protein [Streptomyces sp. SLBN-118]TQK45049.1 hypothetical protein FBY35_6590 [Streptomyces sp. SLBN-118]